MSFFPSVAFLAGSVGGFEWVVLFVVVLIVVGPKNLPEVARKVGRTMEMFRRAADEFKDQLMSMDLEPTSSASPGDTSADAPSDAPYEDPYASETGYTGTEDPYASETGYPGNEDLAGGGTAAESDAAESTPPAEDLAAADSAASPERRDDAGSGA